MRPDIKKLTTVFLILASIAGSASLLLSTFSFHAQQRSENRGEVGSQNASAGDNAFADVASLPPKNAFSAAAGASAGTPSLNLTKRLGDTLAQQLIAANAGRINDPNAKPGLLVPPIPTINDVIAKQVASPQNVSLALPDLNETFADYELKINNAPSAEDVARYNAEVSSALQSTILGAGFQKVLSQDASIEAIYAAETTYSAAIRNIKTIVVPQPLLSFHKSLATLLLNRKKLADLAAGGSDDPLKTIVAIKSVTPQLDSLLARDAQNLVNAAQDAGQKVLSLQGGRGEEMASVIESVFGIARAHAQGQFVPVDTTGPIAIVFQTKETIATTGNWLRRIWEWVQKGLLQELKNQIIHMLESQIVSWINGNGKPQFITDWKGFLGSAFNNAAGAVIDQIAPELCDGFAGSYGAFIRLALHVPKIPVTTYAYRGCTLNQVIGNVKNFYDNFESGGFDAYVAVLQDNMFGVSMDISDAQLNAAVSAQTAAVNKAVAGRGFLSSEICPWSGEPPDETGWCPYGDYGEEPIVRTPGAVLGDTVSKALGSSFDLVVNANDIAGLVSTVADAAISRLISVGMSAVTGRPTGQGLRAAMEVSAADNTVGQSVSSALGGIQYQADTPGSTPETAATPTAGSVVEETAAPAQEPRIDLMNAAASQSYTLVDARGVHDAAKAIDWSADTYSDNRRGGPSAPGWWEVALNAPEHLDAIKFTTYNWGGRYPLLYWTVGGSFVGPFLVLFDTNGNRHTIDIAVTGEDVVNLTTVQARDASGNTVTPSTLSVNKVRFESSQILFADVQFFRHLNPVVKATNVPSLLTSAAAQNFDPRPAQWVTATQYPYYNNPQPITDQTAIKVVVKNAGGNVIDPSSTSPLRYTLAPGSYSFTYTATAGGFTSAPVTRAVTVQ